MCFFKKLFCTFYKAEIFFLNQEAICFYGKKACFFYVMFYKKICNLRFNIQSFPQVLHQNRYLYLLDFFFFIRIQCPWKISHQLLSCIKISLYTFQYFQTHFSMLMGQKNVCKNQFTSVICCFYLFKNFFYFIQNMLIKKSSTVICCNNNSLEIFQIISCLFQKFCKNLLIFFRLGILCCRQTKSAYRYFFPYFRKCLCMMVKNFLIHMCFQITSQQMFQYKLILFPGQPQINILSIIKISFHLMAIPLQHKEIR